MLRSRRLASKAPAKRNAGCIIHVGSTSVVLDLVRPVVVLPQLAMWIARLETRHTYPNVSTTAHILHGVRPSVTMFSESLTTLRVRMSDSSLELGTKFEMQAHYAEKGLEKPEIVIGRPSEALQDGGVSGFRWL